MKPLTKGLVVAALQLALVSSLGAKLLYDRATRPRVWVRTAPVDPEALFRGRYVQLALEVDAGDLFPGGEARERAELRAVELRVEGDRLVATPAEPDTGRLAMPHPTRAGAVVLRDPVAFFIPEHVEDPSQQPPGSELWAEVTLPRSGPPRPIRLGVRREGELTPLEF